MSDDIQPSTWSSFFAFKIKEKKKIKKTNEKQLKRIFKQTNEQKNGRNKTFIQTQLRVVLTIRAEVLNKHFIYIG